MAEYIDREQLLGLINEDCKYQNSTNEYTRGCNEVCDWAIKTIKNIPTADVVPKSEYDAVVSAVDNSTKEFLKLHDYYQEAKREIDKWKGNCTDWCEVAYLKSQRILELEAELSKAKGEIEQIFEEIEKLLHSLETPINKYWVLFPNELAELKNKYAEEKT